MPLFRCQGCNMRIERSMATYWRNKGKLLCSSCLDSRETTEASPQTRPQRAVMGEQGNNSSGTTTT